MLPRLPRRKRHRKHKNHHTILDHSDIAKRTGTVVHGALNIAAQPGKLFSHPAKTLFHKHYATKRFARTVFVIDIVLGVAVLALVGVILALTVFQAAGIEKQIRIDATVAPRDVVSGASSTLVFRYENQSEETLNHAALSIQFPAYFSLQDVDADAEEIGPQVFDLGTIDPGASGFVKIRGVMFGDVGGEQTFTTSLTFLYDEKNKSGKKVIEHVFRPVRSTLNLNLELPDRLIEGSEATGFIVYQNTGEVAVPEISIEPVWPDGFEFLHATAPTRDGQFRVEGLEPGSEGRMEFTGRLPQGESIDFLFHPSFTFGDDQFRQESLKKTVPLFPSQLELTFTTPNTILNPGETVQVDLRYEHVGELTITDAELRLNLDGPIFGTNNLSNARYEDGAYVIDATQLPELDELQPGDTGTYQLQIPLNRSFTIPNPSDTTELLASMRTSVRFVLPDGIDQTVESFGRWQTFRVTTPAVLQSFGRYTSPQGDQLGRGPLPPYVGAETKYWVFLTLTGTANTLENVNLSATLGPNVRFTGKQSVSVGQPVSYDAGSNAVAWTIGSVDPTLAPGSQVVSVAFEVALTPTQDMVGSYATLVSNPTITARDAFTDGFVSAVGASATTNMPYDEIAAGLGVIEE